MKGNCKLLLQQELLEINIHCFLPGHNMLLYLNELFQNYEIINGIKKAIDFGLENIRLTSLANAENVIKERLSDNEA